mgnify:CR=1 FL=1
MELIEHYVGGKKFSGESKRTGKVFNPATGEQSAEVKLASKSDLNEAVKIANKAFEDLMGGETDARKKFIAENSLKVANLDI